MSERRDPAEIVPDEAAAPSQPGSSEHQPHTDREHFSAGQLAKTASLSAEQFSAGQLATSTNSSAEHCPQCGRAMQSHRCKLVCECGYFMSCSEF